MSQAVGQVYKSRIPELSDDASIEEALRVYHYGVDNYTTQPIPNDSIEGNFRTLTTNLSTTNSNLSALDSASVKRVSLTSNPNILTAQNTTTVPLTIKQIVSQTSNLQEWQNSSSAIVANMTSAGTMHLAGNLGVGTTSETTTISLNVVLPNSTQKGIVVKAAASATGNLQEWQDYLGTALARLASDGSFFSQNVYADGNIQSNTKMIARLPVGGTDNIQEWQNSSGIPLTWVAPDGRLYVQGNDINDLVEGGPSAFLLMGA